MKLSAFIQDIKASATLTIAAKAKRLKSEGVDIISFGAGEPDFPTPKVIGEAAKAAIDDGQTLYTPVSGTAALKAAIRATYERKLGMSYADSEIIACTGAKQALFNLFFALLDPGDEVLIPSPCWVSYPAQVKMAGGVPVLVHGLAADGFVPTIEALRAAVTPRTTAIILNNPTNPTGAFWDREQLTAIAEFLREHPSISVVSDSIYDELVYDGLEFCELLSLAPELRDRYFLINGFSKSFAMTGWRLGYALGPAEVISAMGRLQSQSTSNPNSVTQAASIVALEHGETLIAPMRAQFESRRDLVFGLLSAIPGLKVTRPRGAFYIFPDASALIGRSADGQLISDDLVLANWLIDAARIAVVPGGPFGAPGFFRMSYACSEDAIREGCARLAEALGKLH
jgi:aspartate aminotransferase